MLIAVSLSMGAQTVSTPPSSSSPDVSKEAYVVERWYTRIAYESDGTGTRERTAEIKVLSEAGVKAFAVLTFSYTSDNESVDFDYVRVRKPDGTVVKTPEYNIQDMSAEVSRSAPLYSDLHEKHVAVKSLAAGDTLEYLIRVRVVRAQVPGHFWYEDSFLKDLIVRDERLEISVPSGKYVKIVNPDYKADVQEEAGRKIYRWKRENLTVKEKDPFELPRRIPPRPDVQVTTFSSWDDIGRWYGELQRDALAVTPALQAKATELTKGLKTDDEKIHAIYNFVSLKFHYIGLDFGIGRYQPHAADDVLDNGYGDCKDKHTLLASLLKAAGIDAWPALIHATRKLDPDVPSPAQFNHVITVVPQGEKFLWLDSTPEVAPYGLILGTIRGKQALVIPTGKSPVLMTTPENPPFPQERTFSAEGKLSADGTFTGHIAQSYRGDWEVLLRSVFRQVSESQWKEAVQGFSQGLNFGGEVSNVKMSDPSDLDKPFQFSYDYVRKNFGGDWEHHQITAPLPPVGMELARGLPDRKPVEPLQLIGLGKTKFESKVELPPGFLAVTPAKSHVTSAFAEYSGDTEVKGGVMITTRELEIRKNEIAVNDWEEYTRFGHALADDEFAYIRLSGPGLGTSTPEEQETQMRKMLEDDPGNAAAAGSLAAMLIKQQKSAEAIEVLTAALAKAPENASLQYQLGDAYARSGKNDPAMEHLRKAVEIKDDDALVLNNVAYSLEENKLDLALARKYADSSLDEIDDLARNAKDDKDRLRATYLYSLLWDTLGWIDFAQGDNKNAEQLVRAAWLLGEEEVVSEHLGEIYEKAGKKQQAAQAYENALAVASLQSAFVRPALGVSVGPSVTVPALSLEDQIRERYRKMMGKSPDLMSTHRLPNGEWTQTPAEKLRHTREVKLANQSKLDGEATFLVELQPGKPATSHYENGDRDLEPIAPKLNAAHYPFEFPEASEAILTVRVDVRCQAKAACTGQLMPAAPGRP